VYTQKRGTTCFHQSHHYISLGSGPLPLDVNNPLETIKISAVSTSQSRTPCLHLERKVICICFILICSFLIMIGPKGLWPFFLKKHPKTANSSSRSPNEKKNYFFVLSTIGSSPRLVQEYVQKVSQKLTSRIVRL
jgi:hypothetical protein